MEEKREELLKTVYRETIPSLLKRSLDMVSSKTGLKKLYTQQENKSTIKKVELWSHSLTKVTLGFLSYKFEDHYLRYARVLYDFLSTTYLKSAKGMECIKIAVIRLYLFVLALVHENSRCYRKFHANKDVTRLSGKVLSTLRAELNRFLVH